MPNTEREEKRQTFPEIRRGTKGLCVFFCSGADRKEKKIRSPSLFPRLIANAKDTFDFCHFLANKTGIRIIRYIKIAFFYSVKLFSSIIFPYILLRIKDHIEICAFFAHLTTTCCASACATAIEKPLRFLRYVFSAGKKVSLYTYISQA